MPVYEYRCGACSHEFEEWQKISDPPVKTCPTCKKKKVERLISATSFVLKGGGWYKDLYSAKPGGAESKGDSESSSDAKADSKADAKAEAKADSKAEKSDKSSGDAKSTKADGKGGSSPASTPASTPASKPSSKKGASA
jgi:putative FmdB family regulatory protein